MKLVETSIADLWCSTVYSDEVLLANEKAWVNKYLALKKKKDLYLR